MKIYLIVSEDGSRVLTNLDTGKFMAWENRETAEHMLADVGDDYGVLRVEGRDVEDGAPVARKGGRK